MRCSQLRALRHTTALPFATALYGACTPSEMVSDDGHGGSTGAAGTSGRGGSTGAAGTGTAGTTGAGGESGTLQANIDKITAQTGLPVYISEYDLNIADDNQQKNVMQSQFTMFWNDKNVAGITIWGYIVGSTWVANSGLMTSSGTKRPAMTWLMDFLGR